MANKIKEAQFDMSRRGAKFDIRPSHIEKLRLEHANTEREALRRVTLDVRIINFRVMVARAARMIQHQQRFCMIQARAQSARLDSMLAMKRDKLEKIRVDKLDAQRKHARKKLKTRC